MSTSRGNEWRGMKAEAAGLGRKIMTIGNDGNQQSNGCGIKLGTEVHLHRSQLSRLACKRETRRALNQNLPGWGMGRGRPAASARQHSAGANSTTHHVGAAQRTAHSPDEG